MSEKVHERPHHDLDIMNGMEAERGLIDWEKVEQWFTRDSQLGDDQLERVVVDILTGDATNGHTPYEANTQRFDVQGLMYYLYLLNQTNRLDEVLGEVYKDGFRQTPDEKDAEFSGALMPIPRVIAGDVITYLCLRREHELAGTEADEQETTQAALHDLVQFTVGMASDDFGEFSWGDALRSGKVELLKDIVRITAESVLEKFPCTKELALDSDEYSVEHHLEIMPTPLLTTLIHYLGHIAPKLKTSAAVKLGKLVRHMEMLLAKKIEVRLISIPETELPRRLHGILNEDLYKSIKELQRNDGPERAEKVLKNYQMPIRKKSREEAIIKREGFHQGLKVAAITALVAYLIKKIFGEKDDRKDR